MINYKHWVQSMKLSTLEAPGTLQRGGNICTKPWRRVEFAGLKSRGTGAAGTFTVVRTRYAKTETCKLRQGLPGNSAWQKVLQERLARARWKSLLHVPCGAKLLLVENHWSRPIFISCWNELKIYECPERHGDCGCLVRTLCLGRPAQPSRGSWIHSIKFLTHRWDEASWVPTLPRGAPSWWLPSPASPAWHMGCVIFRRRGCVQVCCQVKWFHVVNTGNFRESALNVRLFSYVFPLFHFTDTKLDKFACYFSFLFLELHGWG